MKKWTKIFCCVLLVGLFAICGLTGCATVGNIKNSSTEIVYNGNSAVMVDGYLYFGNAYANIGKFSSDADYKSNAGKAFLARVNTNASLEAKSENHSPKNVENVASEVAAFDNSFMFVLGQEIFYATPNRQKVSSNNGTKNEYTYTCIYRSNLNGDKKKKLYTTDAKIDQIEVLKNDGTYYIVMLFGGNLVKINLSNGKSQLLASDVKTVALPKTFQKDKIGSTLNWNGFVYFTKAQEGYSDRDVVSRAKLDGTVEEIYNNNSQVSLVGREEDVVFFTEKTKTRQTTSYLTDLSADTSKSTFNNNRKEIETAEIKDVKLICTQSSSGISKLGYIFSVGSDFGFCRFEANSIKTGVFTLQNAGSPLSSFKTLFVTGRTMYLSTTGGLFRADLSAVFDGASTTVDVQTIVTMKSVHDGSLYAFDGTYVYFFAGLEDVQPEFDKDGNEIAAEEDANLYLYRAKVGGENKWQLLGLASINSRRS